jgi:hypothetical protein
MNISKTYPATSLYALWAIDLQKKFFLIHREKRLILGLNNILSAKDKTIQLPLQH